ncbi:MAG: DNA (cytosine-5-)-methyltransferase [Rhizobiaceae bacterium]|nr:MAG: DNA (cytosine-5-)-methyltransferase [Rhizobiaceae bacterium]
MPVASAAGVFMRKTFIEFFAGVGLIHEALAQLGWKAVLANDNDQKKVRAYKANYPDVAFSDQSIHDLCVRGLPKVDLATASFPCIDLSQAGYREGIHGQHSGLVWTFLEKIREMKDDGNAPRFLLLENVPNLLSIDDGKAVDFLLSRVAELGYAVDIVQVDAIHFTPQSRNRVFLVAVLEEHAALNPTPDGDHHIRRYRVKQAIERNSSLPWHFFDFPPLPKRELLLADIIQPLPEKDPRWWDEAQTAYFWNLVETEHRQKLKALLEAGGTHYFTAVRRLRRRRVREQIFNVRFDGVASCLRTPKGGSSTQYVVEISNGALRGRRLTGIEAARLQGVGLQTSAPEFAIPDNETEARYAFGDAVCVPAVRWVVQHSIESFISGSQRRQQYWLFDEAEKAA